MMTTKCADLKRQLEDLEDQAEFFKKQCDRFGDESINLEIYKENSINLEDLTEEKRQKIKGYAQKLRIEQLKEKGE